MAFAANAVSEMIAPPTRPDGRPAAPRPATDDGPTFDEHLDAATSESDAPQEVQTVTSAETHADDRCATGGEKPAPALAQDEAAEPPVSDPMAAPLPAPIAAPVMIQIAAASAPVQTQSQPQNNSAPTEAAAPGVANIPQQEATPETGAPNTPPPPAQPALAKAAAPSKPAHDATGRSQTPATPDAVATSNQAQAATPQTSPPAAPSAPVTTETLPAAVQQALAATLAPAPQVQAPAVQRAAKGAADGPEVKPAPDAATPKSAPVAPTTNVKTQAAKAVAAPSASVDSAPVAQSAANPVDTTQAPQGAATTTAVQASTHTQHTAPDTGAQRAAAAGAQVAREIVRRFDGGNTSFAFRLDPAELGRVEVRMEVSRDHKVTAVIAADSPQALSELVRHARELEQQLQDAGLQLSDNGLSFDLRQGANNGETNDANSRAQSAGGGEEIAPEQQATQSARPIGFERWRGVRVDMMV